MDEQESISSQPRIEQVLAEPGYAFGSLGNLVVAVTRQPPTVGSIRELIRVVDASRASGAGRVTIVVAPRARRPSLGSEARQAIVKHWVRLEANLACCVVLFNPSGFVSAIQRSLVTAIVNMRRSPTPVKVSSDFHDAAKFIVSHDPRLSPAEALGVELRRFIEHHEP